MALQTSYTLIRFSKINNLLSFSPSDYEEFIINNKSCEKFRDLINPDFVKGKETGSSAYVEKSDYFFLRTKSLLEYSFLFDRNKESMVPIKPSAFIKQNLKKGMILISKDSKIGEVVYLEKDYPNHMLSAGIVGIELKKNPFYILAFLKNNFFKIQLDSLMSHGSTLAHAKTIFLDCEIPFPNKDIKKTIKFVEELIKAAIRREVQIRKNYEKINNLFEKELFRNQKKIKFNFNRPNFSIKPSIQKYH